MACRDVIIQQKYLSDYANTAINARHLNFANCESCKNQSCIFPLFLFVTTLMHNRRGNVEEFNEMWSKDKMRGNFKK